MAHALEHAKSSVRRFGGHPDDYLPIHQWFDATKATYASWRHRALRHHTLGIFDCESLFGSHIVNSDGNDVPVRLIGEQHVREDCKGMIPTVKDWLKSIHIEEWMGRYVNTNEDEIIVSRFHTTINLSVEVSSIDATPSKDEIIQALYLKIMELESNEENDD